MRMSMKSRCRPFTIADGMVLVAAMGAGLAWSARIWRKFGDQTFSGNSWGTGWQRVIVLTGLILPCLLSSTVGMILVSLRSPSPGWRRNARQPGIAACLAVVISLLMPFPFYLALVVREFSNPQSQLTLVDFPAMLLDLLMMVSPYLGFFVLMTWLLSAVQRRWHPDSGWIDQSGRLVGVLWIASGAVIGAELLKSIIG